jgi:hypothetical protein
MSTVREECDERQTRVDGMIDEFRKAQSRRLAKARPVKRDDPAGESQRGTDAQAAVAVSTATSRTPQPND